MCASLSITLSLSLLLFDFYFLSLSTPPPFVSLSECVVVDVQDNSVVVGSLCVSVEGLEALQSIMEDADHDYTPLSSLEQKAEG